MKPGWLNLLLSLPFLSVTAAFGAEHTRDSLDDVKRGLSQRRAVLVDVRELNEWQAGHLADAQLLPLSTLGRQAKNPRFVGELAKRLGPPEEQVVYVHCKSGGRCLLAADVLIKLGYDARPLKQGYKELLNAGFAPGQDD